MALWLKLSQLDCKRFDIQDFYIAVGTPGDVKGFDHFGNEFQWCFNVHVVCVDELAKDVQTISLSFSKETGSCFMMRSDSPRRA